MEKLLSNQVLASSSGWVAVTLNFFPGLGTGYIYQRRWIPYFITITSSSILLITGFIFRNSNDEFSQIEQIRGIVLLSIVSFITMIESYYAHYKSIKLIELNQKKIIESNKKKSLIENKFWNW